MNFKEKKIEIENILKNIFEEKAELIKNTNSLYSYIDPEFFDKSYEEDIKITKNIEKRLFLVKNLILTKIKDLNVKEEELEFFTTKLTHETYEPILYLYGNSLEKKIKFKTVPKTINNEESFFIIIDFINSYKLLPWS